MRQFLLLSLSIAGAAAFAVPPSVTTCGRPAARYEGQKAVAVPPWVDARPATVLAARQRRRRRIERSDEGDVDVLMDAEPTAATEDGAAEGGGDAGASSAGVATRGTPRTKKYTFDLDVELPIESENRDELDAPPALGLSRPQGRAKALPDGVMPLPDMRELSKKQQRKAQEAATAVPAAKVERGDIDAFTRLLELDPAVDDSVFVEENYDMFASLLGEGRGTFLGLPNSYLQSGHTVLLALCLLTAFVDYPGFPLTQLPQELREFLQRGLAVTYAINIAAAATSVGMARAVKQPWAFWAAKTFVLGGLALNELSQIPPPRPKRQQK